ncbi:E2F-associated phosphoprotein isoform X1 [Anarhichas minor]|uniref:E2F-associated phosphoprotein isoform X1 n=1 Tax=Anarhichas minor TaxID=65739 RepID=UPI003F73AA1C
MNKLNKPQEFDSYEIEEPSDEERAEDSSEDELEVLLNGTPEQKKKLIREYLTGESESSSEDEFEKEMEAELSSTIKTLEGTWTPAAAAAAETPGGGGGGPVPPTPQVYDEVYFDSDSEGEDIPTGSTGRRRRQRAVLTNDELLYDPEEDDRDQAWVDARRRQYQGRKRPAAGSRPRQTPALMSSDAVLNCPACMTTLCLDCQRHEKYRTQYRAMFVMNCTVKKDEVLRYKTQPEVKQTRKKRKRRRGEGQRTEMETPMEDEAPAPAGMDADEVYHPVQCSECSTEVAVVDKDEVFHFFNILASHC